MQKAKSLFFQSANFGIELISINKGKAEAAVKKVTGLPVLSVCTLCENKKIAVLAPTLNLTQTQTLLLIQTQNLNQTLTLI